MPLSDDRIRELLEELDHDDDTDVTSWEAHFLESVVYEWDGALTDAQRRCAMRMLDKYGLI